MNAHGMKNGWRYLGVLLLAVALAACGGGSAGSGGDTAAATTSETTSAALAEVPADSRFATAQGAAAVAEETGLRVTALTKVSETRVSRTVYDYTFKVTVANGTASHWASVAVFADAAGAGTTVLGNAAHLGPLSAGASVQGDATIVLRHDRTKPFDANALRWSFQSRQAANPGPVSAVVSQAVVKADVIMADARLVPSAQPLLMVDASNGTWLRDQLVVVGGNVYKVVGSSINRAGQKVVSVEGRPFHEAFDKLAFKATFGALVYDAAGAPVVPAGALGVKTPLGAGRGRLDAAPADDEATKLLRDKLGLAACVTPGLATEAEPDSLGYTFGIKNCALGDLLRLPDGPLRDALKAVWFDGTLVHSAKSTYVFDLEKRDNYVQETRQFDGLLNAHVNVAEAVRQAARGVDACKLDGNDVTCEVVLAESKPIPFPIAVVGGVAVNAEFQLKWLFEVTLTGDMNVSYGVRSRVVKVSGMQAGVAVNSRSAPETALYQPVTSTGWESGLTGGIDESTSIGFELKLGTVAYSPVSVAQLSASLGAYVRAEATKDLKRGTSICLTNDKGIVLKGSVDFLPAESIGFAGIPLYEEDVRFPWGEPFSLPADCADEEAGGRFKFLYQLVGREFHALVSAESGAGRDVYRVSGAWLKQKQAEGTPFQVDLTNLLVASRLPASKLLVTAGVPVKPEGSGARAVVELKNDPVTRAPYPVVLVYPGTTQPGQSLTAAITVSVPGQPDRTVNKQIKLDMEPTLDAAPTYRYFVQSGGFEGYKVQMNFKGLAQTLTRLVRIELSNRQTQVVLREKRLDVNGVIVDYQPDEDLVTYQVEGSLAVVPVALLLDTEATAGKGSSYRIPISMVGDVKVVSPFTITPTPALVGETLTLEISGESLPNKEPEFSGDDQRLVAELRTNFPACKDFVEVRDPALERKGLYSTEYRKIKCVAKAVAINTRINVFDGQGYGIADVGLDPIDAIQLHVSPASPTVFERVMLWVSEVYSTVKSVVWAFADATMRQVAEVIDRASTVVTTVFETPGRFDARAIFKDQPAGAGNTLGSQTFSIDVRPAAPALPAAPLLSQASLLADGTAVVAGTAAPGVGVRVTWPDATTDTAIAAPTTGAFSFTRGAAGMKAGDSVSVVAYNTAGSSPAATRVLDGLVAVSPVGDLSGDFSATQNPSGPWSYGWAPSLGSAFTRFKANVHPPVYGPLPELQFWSDVVNSSFLIAKNISSGPVNYGCCASIPSQGVVLHPGPSGQKAIARWTAAQTGTVQVQAGFTLAEAGSVDVHVQLNGVDVYSDVLGAGSRGAAFVAKTLAVQAGDTIDFVVGDGGNGSERDTTMVTATVATGSSDTLEGAIGTGRIPRAPWSFGWQASNGAQPVPYGAFTPAGTRADYPTLSMWNKGEGIAPASVYPYVYKNTGATPVTYRADVTDFPSQAVVVTPGSAGERAVFRWTAPASGAYDISARFELMQGGTVDVRVQKNGTDLFVNQMAGKGSVASAPAQTVSLNAGDVIDFAVGDGGNGQNSDITRVWASVSAASSRVLSTGDTMIASWHDVASSPTFGSESYLYTCGAGWGGTGQALLRFDHGAVPVAARAVYLNLYAVSGDDERGGTTMDVVRISGSWSEASTQWISRPPLAETHGSFAAPRGQYGRWLRVPITSLVKAWQSGVYANQGLAVLGVTDPTTGCRMYASREAAGNEPYLSWE